MSLVNDMLRDLEKRNEQTTVPGAKAGVQPARSEPTESNQSVRYLLWAIGILALVATGWLLWQDNLSQVPENKVVSKPVTGAEKTLQVPATENTEERTTAAITPVVTINEMLWAHSEQGGDLVVRLDGAADIQVLSQDEQVITVAFDEVAVTTSLPNTDNSIVESLDLTTESGRTLMTLVAKQRSHFAVRVQQNPSSLVLGIVSLEPPETTATEVASAHRNESRVDPAKPVVKPVEKPSPVVESTLTTVKPVTKSLRKESQQQRFERARELVSQGRLQQAKDQLEKLIAASPTSAQRERSLLASVLISMGEQAEAQRLLKKSLQLHGENRILKKLQSRIWLQQSEPAKVIDLLTISPPLLSEDSEYFELLAGSYQQKGEPDQAARIYYQLLQHNSQVPRWWVGLGYALEQTQRFPEAMTAYQNGLKIPSIDSGLKNYARQRMFALADR